MGMPSKLKQMNIFNEGSSYVGQATSMTLPNLERKMEAYRAGGMNGSVKVDHGLDENALQVKWKMGGYTKQVVQQMGTTTASGVLLRFTQGFQRDDTGAIDNVEIVVRGRHSVLDRGEAKVGEDTEWDVTTECVYYKESINGEVLVEIDLLNMIEMYAGVDRMEILRRAIGI
jgi:P2 family phage contractile tail tube protein